MEPLPKKEPSLQSINYLNHINFSLSQPTGDDFFSNMVKQENARRVEADSDANITQAACSLQNREECMGCGS